jgi:cardiolipin hydrolase
MKRTSFLFAAILSLSSVSFAMEIGDPETCFSPAEACDKKLISFIQKSQRSLDVAIYAITHPDIASAIVQAHRRGVTVRMVADRSQSQGNSSKVGELRAQGVPLKIGAAQGLMHNKFTILDGQSLELGSFNYTRSASTSHAENQLYIGDPMVVEKFRIEFEKLWAEGLDQ